MYIYHALINALSAHMIHINLNMIFYTHVKHSPTKTTMACIHGKQSYEMTHIRNGKSLLTETCVAVKNTNNFLSGTIFRKLCKTKL